MHGKSCLSRVACSEHSSWLCDMTDSHVTIPYKSLTGGSLADVDLYTGILTNKKFLGNRSVTKHPEYIAQPPEPFASQLRLYRHDSAPLQ